MTITAKDLELAAAEVVESDVNVEEFGSASLVAVAIYQTGAALVAAIDRNTEARKGDRERTEP